MTRTLTIALVLSPPDPAFDEARGAFWHRALGGRVGPDEIRKAALDGLVNPETADKLLSGDVEIDDSPAAHEELRQQLAADLRLPIWCVGGDR